MSLVLLLISDDQETRSNLLSLSVGMTGHPCLWRATEARITGGEGWTGRIEGNEEETTRERDIRGLKRGKNYCADFENTRNEKWTLKLEASHNDTDESVIHTGGSSILRK
ncbi:uncharacterized protein LOC143901169 isoform X1 [Temnothorax americanus]|uniref:uncharacterized protein LOC143901169 isoform X1 n=1 Tax=Temnothorax americanus TaxID=1964332 RepID=UPI0040679425